MAALASRARQLLKPNWFLRLRVDIEPKDIGAGIVPHHVEVELSAGQFGTIEVGRPDAFFPILGAGQNLPQGPDDAASAANQDLLVGGEASDRISGRKIAAMQEL